MNESLTGLEWCEGKWLFIFGEQCFNQFFKKCLTQTFFFFANILVFQVVWQYIVFLLDLLLKYSVFITSRWRQIDQNHFGDFENR